MKVLLGVTGGISAYKALELVRLFIKAGHQVQVVMTAGAKKFIQPLSFQALSGQPVRDSLFDANQEAGMGHIELARWADVIVVAPASAETLAKLRMGRADDLLTTLCLATDKPILVAPAMNRLMWQNDATQDNVTVLKQRGMTLMQPGEGEQACGEVGEGRMPEPAQIFDTVLQLWRSQPQNHQAWLDASQYWQGKRLLITAGPTFEDIDPVRYLGNRSSGKMGFAIADIAAKLGAEVHLIAGPVSLATPLNVTLEKVRSAQQMFTAVQAIYASVDVMIGAAAVADFRVEVPARHKIKKTAGSDSLALNLVKNPDIIAWVAQQADKPYVVGFAAETQEVLNYAKVKLLRKNLDMICANQVGAGQGFETAENALTFITHSEEKVLPSSLKHQQAFELLAFLSETIG